MECSFQMIYIVKAKQVQLANTYRYNNKIFKWLDFVHLDRFKEKFIKYKFIQNNREREEEEDSLILNISININFTMQLKKNYFHARNINELY